MTKFLNLFLALFFISLISACASVDYSHKAVFPQAQPDQALIYFYRTPGFIGSTYRFNVIENNQVVGAMAQNSYFYLFAEAGEHSYSVGDRNANPASLITMNLQAGKTYYVKVDVEYQVVGGKPVFSEVDESEAMKLLPSRVYVVPAKVDLSTFNVHAE